ncbi:hypothetical protein SUSAZ_08635 [Sulfolobus acidocaldarius SUSAZ]|nr:hypothetical protein SUSAZ_08635 [Sulfolobus acidocaldarius SUSAZ]
MTENRQALSFKAGWGFYSIVKMLNLVKMMREETRGNGYISSIKCVLMLKNNIPESQGGWNEGLTRGIGVKWLKT